MSSLFFIDGDRADPMPSKNERQGRSANIFFFHEGSLQGHFLLNLTFEQKAALQLKGAFALSSMNNPEDFLVRNMLQATSEGLIRMPLLAVLLSFVGAVINAFIKMLSRRIVLVVTFIIPIMFVAGALALWYADSLNRSARPPFILSGVALAGVALSSAHAILSALRRTRCRTANQM